jgi:hypothetical protein
VSHRTGGKQSDAIKQSRGRGRFTDTDVADVAQLATAGLIQTADSAA